MVLSDAKSHIFPSQLALFGSFDLPDYLFVTGTSQASMSSYQCSAGTTTVPPATTASSTTTMLQAATSSTSPGIYS